MSIHKLVAFAACLALAAAPLAGAAAETNTKVHHRYRAKKPAARCTGASMAISWIAKAGGSA